MIRLHAASIVTTVLSFATLGATGGVPGTGHAATLSLDGGAARAVVVDYLPSGPELQAVDTGLGWVWSVDVRFHEFYAWITPLVDMPAGSFTPSIALSEPAFDRALGFIGVEVDPADATASVDQSGERLIIALAGERAFSAGEIIVLGAVAPTVEGPGFLPIGQGGGTGPAVPMPLPPGLALLGAGLLWLGLRARRAG